jgi:hypothetical protein
MLAYFAYLTFEAPTVNLMKVAFGLGRHKAPQEMPDTPSRDLNANELFNGKKIN